jgi:hypothetical protein
VSQTHLKSGTELSHTHYVCYRLDRVSRPKGGLAVMVRHDLPHTLVSSSRKRAEECIRVSVDSFTGPIEFISDLRTFLTIGTTFFASRFPETAFSAI